MPDDAELAESRTTGVPTQRKPSPKTTGGDSGLMPRITMAVGEPIVGKPVPLNVARLAPRSQCVVRSRTPPVNWAMSQPDRPEPAAHGHEHRR